MTSPGIKKKWLFPLYLVEPAVEFTKLSTAVRIKRDGVWYEVLVSEKLPPLQYFSTNGIDGNIPSRYVDKLFDSAYKVQHLFKVPNTIEGKKSFPWSISPIQMSEKERLNLIHRLPLEGLENLI